MAVAGEIPALRRRVRTNMSMALGPDVPPHAERLYFNRVGWFLANALSVFHHGAKAWAAFDEIRSDESIGVLDAAVAEGRGAVIVSPHWCGHELIGAQINRRYPMTFLVRRASSTQGMERKLKWHKALGAEIVLRPNHASTVKDAVIYLNVLKRGKVLAITPAFGGGPAWDRNASLRAPRKASRWRVRDRDCSTGSDDPPPCHMAARLKLGGIVGSRS